MWPRGIRGRLIVTITVVAASVVGLSFFVVHQRTGSDLESRIDDQLNADLAEFEASSAADSTTSRELARRSRRFVNGQAYHPDSRIFVVEIGGTAEVVTNNEELVESELGEAEDEGDDDDAGPTGILTAEPGLQTVGSGDDSVRVLTRSIDDSGRTLGTFHVAQSLASVAEAQDSLRSTFLIIGLVGLIVLLAAAGWIAALIARPLDRIARFAAEIDRGELDRRLAEEQGPAEVLTLTTSLNRMLDRLQRAFDREREFVADASHELRTPITIAQGELELLRRDVSQAERDRLDVVRRELRRMEGLIGDMLSLAREDAGRSLDKRVVAVDDLLDDLRRDLPLLGRRSYEVEKLSGTVEVDPDRIAQVLRNLSGNAVAHSPDGSSVRVEAQARGDRVRFAVTDQGPGIDADEAEHLFERFYRSADSRARAADGSGLGLAIAKAIVDAHGGDIWVDPTHQAGARVLFELPGYRPAGLS